MHRFATSLIAGGLLALGLGAQLPAQEPVDARTAHSIDVREALRSGRDPGLLVAPMRALSVGECVEFTLPTTTGSPAGTVSLVVDRVERVDQDRWNWLFRSRDGGFAHAQFISIGDVIAGSISAGDGTAWRVLRDPDGSVRVDPLDEQHLPPCGNRPAPPEPVLDEPAVVPPRTRVQLAPSGRSNGPGEPARMIGGELCSTRCSTRFVDLAVFYTPNALAGAGGLIQLEALLDLAVLQGNASFANSGSTIQMRVLGFESVDYNDAAESGHLEHLADPNDGYLDEVPVRRDALGADISSLIVEYDEGWCGVADLFPARYHICTRFCLGSFVLAHELGHNLGACHAEGDGGGCAPGPDLLPYARGYRFNGLSGTQWRTVMAYNPGIVIPYFSTPLVSFDGVAVGEPATSSNPADNVLAMSMNEDAVKDFGCPIDFAQTIKVLPASQQDFDQFGQDVVLTDDQLVVGGPSTDEVADDSGSVFLYERLTYQNCSGSQVYGSQFDTCYRANGILPVPDLRENDVMGSSLAESNGRLVVGTPLRDSGPLSDPGVLLQSGSVFVYELDQSGDDSAWCFDSELVSDDPQAEDRFGSTVAIDGATLVAGAPRSEVGGTVELFSLNSSNWQHQQTIHASDFAGIGLDDQSRFGEAIAISGSRMSIGAPGAFDGEGAIIHFQKNPVTSQWQYTQYHAGYVQGGLGSSLSMDGDLLVAGYPGALGGDGFAHIYRRSGSTWVFTRQLRANLIPSSHLDYCDECMFGASVAIQGDRLVVGAPTFTALGLPSAGATYLYEYDSEAATWYLVERFFAFDPEPNQLFGSSVDLLDGRVAIGAVADDTNGIQTGAAYVYRFRPFVDCNENGYSDDYEVIQGISTDANQDGIPDDCNCLGDLDGNSLINGADLTLLLTSWGTSDPIADVTGDGQVDARDLAVLLAGWGVCSN